MAWKAQNVRAGAGTMGSVPDSLLGHPSTARAQRVSQAESVATLAARRAGQKGMVASRMPTNSGLKIEGVNTRRTMAEQNYRGGAVLRDARVK